MTRGGLALIAAALLLAGCSQPSGVQTPSMPTAGAGVEVHEEVPAPAGSAETPSAASAPASLPPTAPPVAPPVGAPEQQVTASSIPRSTPDLRGLQLTQAQQEVFGTGVRLGPYLQGPGSPYDPACRIVDQQPPPGVPLSVDLIRVLLECQPPS